MSVAVQTLNEDAAWNARVELALCYRVVAHYGLTDQIYTHISARLPGAEDRFLINRMGIAFDEMRASDLVEVGLDGFEKDTPVNSAGPSIKHLFWSTMSMTVASFPSSGP